MISKRVIMRNEIFYFSVIHYQVTVDTLFAAKINFFKNENVIMIESRKNYCVRALILGKDSKIY